MKTSEKIIVTLQKEGILSAVKISAASGLVLKTVSNELPKLVKDGKIIRTANGKAFLYELPAAASKEKKDTSDTSEKKVFKKAAKESINKENGKRFDDAVKKEKKETIVVDFKKDDSIYFNSKTGEKTAGKIKRIYKSYHSDNMIAVIITDDNKMHEKYLSKLHK